MKNLLIISVCFIILIFLYAFSPQTVHLVFQGKVFDQSEAMQSVNIKIESKPNYFETSISSGYYRLQFNADQGHPQFILYSKDGYTTFRRSWIPTGDENNIYSIPDIHLLKIKRSNPEELFDNPKIKIYPSTSMEQSYEIYVKEIAYFEKVERLISQNGTLYWYKVNFTIKETGKRHSAFLLQ